MALVEQSRRADDGRDRADGTSGAERWARVKALFLEALTYSESERSAFLARAASSDSALLAEVESLLATEQVATSFCETPAADVLGAAGLPPAETPRLATGTRLGVYEITGFIAAGGMGAVYRGRHTVLGREVAIKTLVLPFADSAARRRLIREARHASALAHPNICAVYDVGEEGELPFIAMQYVDGQSLGAEIARDGPPALERALDYAIQIAAALEHAHRHGIIHRDLKSSNVVVDTDGRAIVLDFGLARRAPDLALPDVTESTAANSDALAGTLSHMAPELLHGEPADARSDVWALGVLLYQLLCGSLPFTGRTAFETSSAILTGKPHPMSARVPLALRLIVERCLTKDPHHRYRSAREVGVALAAARRRHAWPLLGRLLLSSSSTMVYAGTAMALVALALLAIPRANRIVRDPGAAGITSLALLPLSDTSGDASSYYADGITEALISQVGSATGLRVVSPASVARLATSSRSMAEIGRSLSADAVLRGSITRTEANVSLALQLVRVSDGRVLWADRLVRPQNEILALEADLVYALTSAIRVDLRPGASERLSTVRSVAPEVYESYLKGRYEWNHRTPQSLLRAVDHFTHAVQLDPTYAPAHAGLADCYNQLGTVLVGSGSPRRFRPLAEAEAIKALQIDQSSAEAHAALGFVRHYQLRWREAEQEFRRAIELNPSLSLTHVWYANMLMSRRRMAEALEEVNVARELDPFSLVVNTNVAWILGEAGRPRDAITQLQQTLALDSTYAQARIRLAGALMEAGRLPEAYAEAHHLLVVTDSAPSVLALLAMIEAHRGRADAARLILRQLEAQSKRRYVPAVSLAHVQAALGDIGDAMDSMERAYAEGSNAIAYLDVEPAFTPLRGDARFEALRARAGLK